MLALAFSGCSDQKSSPSGNSTDQNISIGNTTSTGGNNTNTSMPDDNTTLTDKDNTQKYICAGGGKVMNDYQLPPCPDSVENDKTLLGIDSNNNGVRDDVEIWIYHTYDTYTPCVEEEINVTLPDGETVQALKDVCENTTKPYHQIVREIAMQYARAYQIVIQEPEKARENVELVHNAIDCEWYFKNNAKYLNEPILINDNYLYKALDDIQFNTIQRARAYHEYNFHLSGGAYSSHDLPEEERASCDFSVDTLLGK
ncbi:MAG: hypothetical protein LBH45_02245 [Campylobacteraceae bacterium]|nr:hypothetical protein [Campylobacteraceae bacterium]